MERERNYVLSHFFKVYAVPGAIQDALLKEKAKVSWPSIDGKFFQSGDAFPEDVSVLEYEGKKLPFFFREEAEDLFSPLEDGFRLHFDWISASFYFLSGFQEQHRKSDESRFSVKDSFQYKYRVHRLPVVNYYFDLLRSLLEKAYEISLPFVNENPGLLLTHDIDLMRSGWKTEGFNALKQGRLLLLLKIAFGKMLGNDPYENISEILAIEEKEGVKATYFFLAAKGPGNADYDVRDRKPQESIAKIVEAGSEVGVHGALNSCFDGAQLKKEMGKVGKNIVGNRFHYLHFAPGSTPETLEEAGLLYDASLGFFDEIGFRHGYCHAFDLWSWKNNGPSGMVEIPLNMMDTTLAGKHYFGTTVQASLEMFRELAGEVKQFRGNLSLLWHNNYFSPVKYKEWTELYPQMIRFAKSIGFESPNSRQVAHDFMHSTNYSPPQAK